MLFAGFRGGGGLKKLVVLPAEVAFIRSLSLMHQGSNLPQKHLMISIYVA
jgi:hypothetical protein